MNQTKAGQTLQRLKDLGYLKDTLAISKIEELIVEELEEELEETDEESETPDVAKEFRAYMLSNFGILLL
jgi:hypothetical protein